MSGSIEQPRIDDGVVGDTRRASGPPRLLVGGARREEAVLILVTATWGASFMAMKHGLTYTEPMTFVALRFTVAALTMALLAGRCLGGLTRTELVGGVLIGAMLAVANGLQGVGLLTITSSASAFFTALYVPLVPVLAWMVTRRTPSRSAWLAIALAFTGVSVMSGVSTSSLGLGAGEVATILSAVAIGAEILLISRYAPHVNIKRIAVVQLATCGLLSASAASVLGEPAPRPSWGLLATAGTLGLTSAFIQLAMSWAQSSISAVRATVIYAAEPLWAGLIGVVAGEPFTSGFVLGAALVILGLLLPAMRRPCPSPTTPPATLLPPSPEPSSWASSSRGVLSESSQGDRLLQGCADARR